MIHLKDNFQSSSLKDMEGGAKSLINNINSQIVQNCIWS